MFYILISLATAQIVILQPEELTKQLGNISYTANLNLYISSYKGSIGHNLKTSNYLRLSYNISNCVGTDSEIMHEILLIDPNDCNISTQLKFASGSQVNLVMIISDKQINISNHYIYKIVSISQDIGKVLKPLLYQSQSSSIYITIYPLKLYYRLLSQNDTLIDIKLDIQSPQAYELLEELAQYQAQVREFGCNFQIYYQLDVCYSCKKRHNFTQFERNCYENGKYCIVPTQSYYTGLDLLDHIIALNCLWQQSINKWWHFMMLFKERCIEVSSLEICRETIFEELDVDRIALQFCTKTDQIQLLESYANYLETDVIINYNGTKTVFESDKFGTDQMCSYFENTYQMIPQFCDLFIQSRYETIYYTPIVQALVVIPASIGLKLIGLCPRKPEKVFEAQNLEIY